MLSTQLTSDLSTSLALLKEDFFNSLASKPSVEELAQTLRQKPDLFKVEDMLERLKSMQDKEHEAIEVKVQEVRSEVLRGKMETATKEEVKEIERIGEERWKMVEERLKKLEEEMEGSLQDTYKEEISNDLDIEEDNNLPKSTFKPERNKKNVVFSNKDVIHQIKAKGNKDSPEISIHKKVPKYVTDKELIVVKNDIVDKRDPSPPVGLNPNDSSLNLQINRTDSFDASSRESFEIKRKPSDNSKSFRVSKSQLDSLQFQITSLSSQFPSLISQLSSLDLITSALSSQLTSLNESTSHSFATLSSTLESFEAITKADLNAIKSSMKQKTSILNRKIEHNHEMLLKRFAKERYQSLTPKKPTDATPPTSHCMKQMENTEDAAKVVEEVKENLQGEIGEVREDVAKIREMMGRLSRLTASEVDVLKEEFDRFRKKTAGEVKRVWKEVEVYDRELKRQQGVYRGMVKEYFEILQAKRIDCIKDVRDDELYRSMADSKHQTVNVSHVNIGSVNLSGKTQGRKKTLSKRIKDNDHHKSMCHTNKKRKNAKFPFIQDNVTSFPPASLNYTPSIRNNSEMRETMKGILNAEEKQYQILRKFVKYSPQLKKD
jgi:hypothetical protein